MDPQHKMCCNNRKIKEMIEKRDKQTNKIKENKPPPTQFCLREALVSGIDEQLGSHRLSQKQLPLKKKGGGLKRESSLKGKHFTNFALF